MSKKKKGSGSLNPTGESTTKLEPEGIIIPVTNPMDLWYLCEKINHALANPIIDKDGSRAFQRVVTNLVRADYDAHYTALKLNWPYIGELGYDMTQKPPQPIMSKQEPHRPSHMPLSKYAAIKENYVYKLYGLSTADIRFEVIKYLLSLSELERILTPEMRQSKQPLKKVPEWKDMFKIQRGLIRIPDVVKIRNMAITGSSAFQQDNIDDIIEIKFNETKDRMSKEQKKAYVQIAGNLNKLHLLESKVCQIDDRRKRRWIRDAKKEPLYVPVSMGLKEIQKRVRLEVSEFAHLIGRIDEELDRVNLQLYPITAGLLCEREVPQYNTPHKLEAPMSAMAIREQNRARAQLEMALAGPMWGIGAGATVIALAPAAPVAIGEVAVTTTSLNAIKVGSNVVDFVAISRKAAITAAAATSFDLAARESQTSPLGSQVSMSFLQDGTKQRQEYIYWDD